MKKNLKDLFLIGLIRARQEQLMLSMLTCTYERTWVEKDRLVKETIHFRKISSAAGFYEVKKSRSAEVSGEGQLIFKHQKDVFLAVMSAGTMQLKELEGNRCWSFIPEQQQLFHQGLYYYMSF